MSLRPLPYSPLSSAPLTRPQTWVSPACSPRLLPVAPTRPPFCSIRACLPPTHTPPAQSAPRQSCSFRQCPTPLQNIFGECPGPHRAASAPGFRCTLRARLRRSPPPSSAAVAASSPWRRQARGCAARAAPAALLPIRLDCASFEGPNSLPGALLNWGHNRPSRALRTPLFYAEIG